jgi:hypothetical protein
MFKISITATITLGTTAYCAVAGTTILTVGGASGQYPTIAAAAAAADEDTDLANDYVIRVAPGTYTNDSPQVTRPMTIEAAVPGSTVILNAPAPLANEKGIILASASVTVDGLTLENANISNSLGGNGAGIRDEDTRPNDVLVVRNSIFINNQMGILTDANIPLNTILIGDLFMNNGNTNSSYWGHSIYLGSKNSSLVAIGNEICGTNIGHDIKSRAAINLIENNTLYDGAADANQRYCNIGSASFALDLPNGGVAVVVANTIIRGTASKTPIMFAYGEEGLVYSTNSISFIDNTMDNTGAHVTGIYDNPSTPIPVAGNGNTFASSIATQVNPASADHLTGSISGSISADSR